MRTAILFFLFLSLPTLSNASTVAGTKIGTSISRELRENRNLQLYELFFLRPLFRFDSAPFDSLKLSSQVEYSIGFLEDTEAGGDSTMRFAVMPRLLFTPSQYYDLVLGFGAGYMSGETEYPRHNLGGSFFFQSKVGISIHVTKKLSLGYLFFHQSNAGLYSYNASLNTFQMEITYTL
ncbi:acyloxyacyl hydrolase [Desulfomarina sp.]